MIKDEYSPYKIVHHIDKIQMMRGGKQVMPLQVQIIPSNGCNQRCSFCAYRLKGYSSNKNFIEKNSLSYDKIIECLNDFVDMGVKAVQYTGGGEPLIHKESYQYLKATLDRGLDLSLVSNGMALTEPMCDLLGDACWTRISVDAGSKEMYSYLRSTEESNFRKVLDNIKNLVAYRRKNIVGVGFVVERDNYKEVLKSAKIMKDIGVDNFRIGGVFTPLGYSYYDGFEEVAKDIAKEAELLSDDNFKVFNLFKDRLADTYIGKQEYNFCPMKDLCSYVGADYGVYTCCTYAYNDKGLIGSIRDQSFKDLWYSDKKIKFFNNHNPEVDCQLPCLYREKNGFINYCIKENPNHINFI